ncbi:MAG: radical SAM/SPASM domain-containing protein [Bdellovibrionales bacterium]
MSDEVTPSVNPVDLSVKLRKISSLDGSELFSSAEEKSSALQLKRESHTPVTVPKYPKEPVYKNTDLKSFYYRANYFAAIAKHKLLRKEAPIIAIIVVNNHCNWNCNYCFGDYPNRKEVDYTTDELKFIISELYDLGCRYLNLHGGETLLRKDVGEICNFVKNKGMYLGLITNGSLLSKHVEELRNVDNLTISLDGAREGNEKNRGSGTFEKTIAAIKLGIQEGLKLRVSATITKHTMNDIGYLANLAQSMGFHLYFSILFKPLKKAHDSQMTNDEIRHTLREIKRYRQMGYPIFTSDGAIDAALHWPYDYNENFHIPEDKIPDSYREHHVKCYFSRTKFTIEADGYVYPCFLTTDGSFKPLNWRDVGLKKAIDHVRDTNQCRACPALSHSDHSLLLGMEPKQIVHVVKDQLKESLRIKHKPNVPGEWKDFKPPEVKS